MGKPSRATQAKRSRERAKQERQEEKRLERAYRKDLKKSLGERALADGVDPDLVGIVAGPQSPIQEGTED